MLGTYGSMLFAEDGWEVTVSDANEDRVKKVGPCH